MAEERKYRRLRTTKAKNVPETIKRVLKYITKHNKKEFIIAVICIFVSAFTGVIASYLLSPLVNDGIVPQIGKTNPDMTVFFKVLFEMIAVYISGTIATYTYQKMISIIATGMLDNLRRDLFHVIEKLPVSFFDTRTHGEIMNLYTNDIETIRPMIAETLPSLISALITLVGSFSMMAYLNFKLMLVAFAMLIVILISTYLMGKGSRSMFAQLQDEISNLNGYSEEMFSGQKVVKVFNHEEEAKKGFFAICERLYKASFRTNMFASMLMPINANLAYVTYALVAVVGSKMAIAQTLLVGDLISFLQYVRQFSGPVSMLSQQFNGFMMSLAGAERVFEVMDMSFENNEGKVTLVNVVKDSEELIECENKTGRWAWKKPLGGNSFELIELKGDVRFENVCFSYVEGKEILHNISLFAKPGQKIAFVGSTGAGKTTITNLINRFYDIDSGVITYDGIPIREIRKEDLRRSIGVVLQDTNLFSGTVMDNIRYGRLDASDEDCKKAAKIANADSFIERLPHGYDTMLTANGSNLSQGQRQLLNIARCAVADPPVMILDEATSSIDTHTEKLIEKGMDELMKGRTTFVIAHRLSTVRNSNAIIVLEHGNIIERGDHDDLIQNKGRYYQLYTGKAELD